MDCEDHVAGGVGDNCFFLRGRVVQKLWVFCVGAFCCDAIALSAGSIVLSIALA